MLGSCDESYTQEDLVFQLAAVISGLPAMDYIPEEMQALCDLDSGWTSSPAYGVPGYARVPRVDRNSIINLAAGKADSAVRIGGCFPCLQELIAREFQYIETYYVSAADRKAIAIAAGTMRFEHTYRDRYPNQTGLYRYELVHRNAPGPEEVGLYLYEQLNRSNTPSNDCDLFDNALLRAARQHEQHAVSKPELSSFWRDYQTYKEQLGDRCVAVRRIDKFEAPYVFETEERRMASVPWRLVTGHILRWRARVVRRADDFVIAQATEYRYRVHSGGKFFERRASCGKAGFPGITKILFHQPEGVPEE